MSELNIAVNIGDPNAFATLRDQLKTKRDQIDTALTTLGRLVDAAPSSSVPRHRRTAGEIEADMTALLCSLPDRFRFSEAMAAGAKVGLSSHTVSSTLPRLERAGRVRVEVPRRGITPAVYVRVR